MLILIFFLFPVNECLKMTIEGKNSYQLKDAPVNNNFKLFLTEMLGRNFVMDQTLSQ